jgi:hypothetical protein
MTEAAVIKIVENANLVLADVRELLSRRDQGFRDLHAYLEFQRHELEKQSDKYQSVFYDIVEELGKISKALQATQKVSIANPSKIRITKTEIKLAFIEALETIEKIPLLQGDKIENPS